jgi:hypothetical protein
MYIYASNYIYVHIDLYTDIDIDMFKNRQTHLHYV